MRNLSLIRFGALALLCITVFCTGCGGANRVEFPETPAEMPVEDDEAAVGEVTESES